MYGVLQLQQQQLLRLLLLQLNLLLILLLQRLTKRVVIIVVTKCQPVMCSGLQVAGINQSIVVVTLIQQISYHVRVVVVTTVQHRVMSRPLQPPALTNHRPPYVTYWPNSTLLGTISQLPKLCKRIEYWCIEYLIFILRVRSFNTRLPSMIFAEEKVLIFLILREKC